MDVPIATASATRPDGTHFSYEAASPALLSIAERAEIVCKKILTLLDNQEGSNKMMASFEFSKVVTESSLRSRLQEEVLDLLSLANLNQKCTILEGLLQSDSLPRDRQLLQDEFESVILEKEKKDFRFHQSIDDDISRLYYHLEEDPESVLMEMETMPAEDDTRRLFEKAKVYNYIVNLLPHDENRAEIMYDNIFDQYPIGQSTNCSFVNFPFILILESIKENYPALLPKFWNKTVDIFTRINNGASEDLVNEAQVAVFGRKNDLPTLELNQHMIQFATLFLNAVRDRNRELFYYSSADLKSYLRDIATFSDLELKTTLLGLMEEALLKLNEELNVFHMSSLMAFYELFDDKEKKIICLRHFIEISTRIINSQKRIQDDIIVACIHDLTNAYSRIAVHPEITKEEKEELRRESIRLIDLLGQRVEMKNFPDNQRAVRYKFYLASDAHEKMVYIEEYANALLHYLNNKPHPLYDFSSQYKELVLCYKNAQSLCNH